MGRITENLELMRTPLCWNREIIENKLIREKFCVDWIVVHKICVHASVKEPVNPAGMDKHDFISQEPFWIDFHFVHQTVHSFTGIHPIQNDAAFTRRFDAKLSQRSIG